MGKLSRLRALAEAVRSQVEAVRGGWGSAGAAAAGAPAARRAPAGRRWGYALDVLESRLYFSTVSFRDAQTYNIGANPVSVVAADFNGDGKIDVATANSGTNNVTVLMGNGDGTFGAPASYAVGAGPRALVAKDFNGDGKVDLAVADAAGNAVSVLLNTGTGSFAPAANYAAGLNASAIVAVDVNGDGRPDLAVANAAAGTVSVLLGNADGTFGAKADYAAGASPDALAAGDFNGDGKQDLFVGNDAGVTVFANAGNGALSNPTTYPMSSGVTGLAAGDFNGDGRTDVAAAGGPGGTVNVLALKTDGTVVNNAISAGGATDPVAVTVADVNGDGKADVVATNLNGNTAVVLRGDGAFGFKEGNGINPNNQQAYTTGSQPTAVAAADFTGDGKVDLVTANQFGGSVSVLVNGAGTLLTAFTANTGTAPSAGVNADLNKDGKDDLVVANQTSNTISVLLASSTGSGALSAAVSYAVGTTPRAVVVGDFNGDGNLDVAVANSGSNSVSILLGSATGALGAATTIALAAGAAPDGLAVADVNNDGKKDLIVADAGTNNVSVLTGTGTGTFNAAVTYAVGASPSAVVAADFNGDGKPDLAVANNGAGTVSVLLNSGTGTFPSSPSSTITLPTGAAPRGLAVADVDGDGKKDLVTANNGTNNASVLLGSGTGTFTLSASYAAGTNPTGLALADVDGDGKPDLLVSDGATGGGGAVLLLNAGSGTFAPLVTLHLNLTGPASTAAFFGDLNADGRGDVVVVNSGTNNVSAMLNGLFKAPVTSAIASGPSAVAAADFNRDGKADLVTADTNAAALSVLLNNGDGTYATAVQYAVGKGPTSVIATDVNGDGKVDLVATVPNPSGSGNGTVAVLLGNGDGTFQAAVTAAVGASPASVAAGDFNGDGKVDLAVANTGSNTVTILLGNNTATFTPQASAPVTGNQPQSVAVADFNGDGKLDLVTADYAASTISVILGNGDGTFQAKRSYGLNGDTSPKSVAVGDFNGDGKIDVAAAASGTAAAVVFLNVDDRTTTTTFEGFATAVHYAVGTSPASIIAQSVDGNTTPDLVLADSGSGAVSVLKGNGDGTFAPRADFAAGTTPKGVAVADVDGNGRKDVIAVNSGSQDVSVLRGNGDGTLQDQQVYAVGTNPYAVTSGLLNGDSYPDLAVVNASAGTVSVLLGNADGTFQPAVNYATGSGPHAAAIVDLNGDGKADLVVANSLAGTVSVLLGNGDGTFGAKVDYAAGSGPSGIVVGDFNGDGKRDVAVTDAAGNQVSVLLGNGDGTLAARVGYTVGAAPVGIAAADVTGDGKADLVVAESGADVVGVLAGNGDGTFAAQVTYAVGNGPVGVVTGDFNGDGKTDVATANQGSDDVSVLLNTGSGTLGAATTVALRTGLTPFPGPAAVVAGDFNADGKVDLATADFSSADGSANGVVSVLQGNGDGTFQATREFAAGRSPQGIFAADVNRDGRADLAVANYSGNNVSVLVADMAPSDSLSAAPGSVVQGGSTTLTATFSDPEGSALTVEWDFNYDGTTFNPAGPGTSTTAGTATTTFTAASNATPGPRTLAVRVTDAYGNSRIATTTVTITSAAPSVTINGAPASDPEGTAVNLTSTVTPSGGGYAYVYAWAVTKNGSAYATGTPTNGATFAFTPDDNGAYVVSLTVTNQNNAATTVTKSITGTNVAPTAALGAPSGSPTEGAAVSLIASATDPSAADTAAGFTFAWSVSAGGATVASGTGSNVTFTPGRGGTYAVSVTATDKDGGQSAAATRNVTVANVAPTPTIGNLPASPFEGAAIHLTSTVADPGAADSFTYAWSVSKDGSAYATGGPTGQATFDFTPGADGTYVVSLQVTDADGATVTRTATLGVTDPALVLTGGFTVNAAEGIDPGAQTFATFTDPGVAEPAANYAATVNFGDGSAPAAGVVTYDAAHGDFVVSADHTYAAGGTYAAGVTVAHDGVTSAAVTSTAVVTHDVSATGATTLGEGAPYELYLDPGINKGVASWTVDWGDGSGAQVIPASTTYVAHAFGGTVAASTVTATATRADGTGVYSTSIGVSVLPAKPAGLMVSTLSPTSLRLDWLNSSALADGVSVEQSADGVTFALIATVGATVQSYAVAGLAPDTTYVFRLRSHGAAGYSGYSNGAFATTDSTVHIAGAAAVDEGSAYTLSLSGAAAAGTWTINWGDGTAASSAPGTATSVTHVYANGPANYTVAAHVANGSATDVANTLAVTVNVVNPAVAVSGDGSVNEGSPYTLHLSASEVGQAAVTQWLIDWGDGSDEQTIAGNPPTAQHTYVDGPSAYVISAVAVDANGSYPANPLSVTVNNVAPIVAPLAGQLLSAGATATLSDTFTDPGLLDAQSATVDWGDGTVDNVVPGAGNAGAHTVSDQHRFGAPGTYTVSLGVVDSDGGASTQTAVYDVTAPAAPAFFVQPGNSSPAGTLTLGTDGTLTGWTPIESGGTPAGKGTVGQAADGNLLLTEGNSFVLGVEKTLTVPANPSVLTFGFNNLAFDSSDASGFVRDAFEVAVVDPTTGQPLLTTFTSNRDAQLNFTEGVGPKSDPQEVTLANTTYATGNPNPTGGTVNLDISKLAAGASVEVVLRLVNEDADTRSSVEIVADQQAVHHPSISGPSSVPEATPYTLALHNDGVTSGTWTIAWGDGATSTANAADAVAQHAYADGPNAYTIAATLGALQTNAVPVTVTDVPPTVTARGAAAVDEGATYTLNLSAVEPGTETVSGWTIDWGDGATGSPDVQAVSGNPSSVQHVYADGTNRYTIQATATDQDGPSNANPVSVLVNNVKPVVAAPIVSAGAEGQLVTLTATFTDPGVLDAHTARVSWGDGIVVDGVVNEASHTVTATHRYGEDGTYIPSVTVTDKDGGKGTASGSATIAPATPTLVANYAFQTITTKNVEQLGVVLSGTFTDPGFTVLSSGKIESFKTTVNWGDGTTSILTNTLVQGNATGVPTVGSFTGSHAYSTSGIYSGSVTVTDDDGRSATFNFRYGVILFQVLRTIELKSQGQIPIRIFTSSWLNQNTIDTTSLRLGPGGAAMDHGLASNAPDHVDAQFPVQSSGIRLSDTETYLTGKTTDGTFFVGWSPISVNQNNAPAGRPGSIPAGVTPKFFVVDPAAQNVYRYTATGAAAGYFPLDPGLTAPRGITADAAGDLVWAIDGNSGEVAVYGPTGTLRGTWLASGVTSATGISTNGVDLWVLDAGSKKVLRYVGAALQVAGVGIAATTFPLAAANVSPSDLTTDGNTVWVTDDAAKAVFVYNASGTLLGQWQLDARNAHPSGITCTPDGGGTDLWVTDRTTATVYHYANSTAWTSGTRAATDTFALAAGDTQPEGIADPPTVSIDPKSVPPTLPTGTTVAVSGHVSPDAGTGSPVTFVNVNQAPAAVDAQGNFFGAVTVSPGLNALAVTATDATGAAGSAAATISGSGSLAAAGAIDFSLLSDVSGSMTATYRRTSFDLENNTLFAGLCVSNGGNYDVRSPLIVVVKNLSNGSVHLKGADGTTPDGFPYYVLQSAAGGSFAGGQELFRTLRFGNPQRARFTYKLQFLGHLNAPPVFATAPAVQAHASSPYRYDAVATDPDGDAVSYTLLGAPAGMQLTAYADATGARHARLDWTAAAAPGTYAVSLRADDGHGGVAAQGYAITVNDASVNHPPVFVTTPVVDATMDKAYSYASHATDADGDVLTYSVDAASHAKGISIDASTGLVTWTDPTPFGPQHIVLTADDGHGGTATQAYTLQVADPTNHDPVVVSTPNPDVGPVPSPAPTVDLAPYSSNGWRYKEVASGDLAGFQLPTFDDRNFSTGTGGFGTPGYPITGDTATTNWGGNDDMLLRRTFSLPDGATHLTVGVAIDNDVQVFVNGVDISGGFVMTDGVAYLDRVVLPVPASLIHSGTNLLAIRAHDRGGIDFVDARLSTEIDNVFRYQVKATDSDGDPLTYQLTQRPDATMTIDQTGLITWPVPQGANGDYPVTVLVDDAHGGTATQRFVIHVNANAQPGSISGTVYASGANGPTPVAGATVYLDIDHDGRRAGYEQYQTTGADGRYTISPVQGATDYTVRLDPPTGFVLTAPALLSQTVTVGSGQAVGGIDFQCAAAPTGTPAMPGFIGTPPSTATVGSTYAYLPSVTNPSGTPLTFSLPSAPGGMGIDPSTGLVRWVPVAAEVGHVQGVIRVADAVGGVGTEPFTVTVSGTNLPPVFTSTPPTAIAGYAWKYALSAVDPDNDGVTFSFNPALNPPNMTFDASKNALTWTPPAPGQYPLHVTATDGGGLSTDQVLTLNVAPATSGAPVILSHPGTTAQVDRKYEYDVQATAPAGFPIGYSVQSFPATGIAIDASSGVLTWTPAAVTVAPVQVTVTATANGLSTQQTYALSVTASHVGPSIISTPPQSTTVGTQYVYDAQASDADPNPLAWTLVQAPAGMVIDPKLGTVVWTPTPDEVGVQTVAVRVVDDTGAYSTQTYQVQVRGVNAPPVILSTPPVQVVSGTAYAYPVLATDADGDPLTYSLDQASIDLGMRISSTGLVTWTAGAVTTSPRPVTVTVWDGQYDALGNKEVATQTYQLSVIAAAVNQPPAITSTPIFYASGGRPYAYKVTVSDPDGDLSTTSDPFSLSVSPGGSGITLAPSGDPQSTTSQSRLIMWNSASGGPYAVAVTVTDGHGAYATQGYTLTVVANAAVQIVHDAVQTAVVGLPYEYDVHVTNGYGPFVYTLDAASQQRGLAIDADGRVTWKPTAAGTGNVTVTVSDALGSSDAYQYPLAASVSTQTPVVTVQSTRVPAPVGEPVGLLVSTTGDATGIAAYTLTVQLLDANGNPTGQPAPVAVDPTGYATFTFAAAGQYQLVATATDDVGHTGTSAPFKLFAAAANAAAPVVMLDTPADQTPAGGVPADAGADPRVLHPFDITGSITDASGITSYSLQAVPADGTAPINITPSQVAGNRTSITGVLGRFDPTILANGVYSIVLTATDNAGLTTADQVNVDVDGALKLGNFSLSFTDLSIPVAGIPITVSRTYNTLDANASGDFGYGWSLNFRDVKLQTSALDPASQVGFGNYPGFEDGTRVWITLPGGKREMFTFKPQPFGGDQGNQFQGFTQQFVPAFVGAAGVTDTLSVDPAYLQTIDNGPEGLGAQLVDGGSADAYNPANPEFGGHYLLTTKSGIKYDIDIATGKITSITDTNGNALTLTDTGITNSNDPSQSVTFTRDYLGRITAITDPAGKTRSYAYDAAGNLVSFTDAVNRTTGYKYAVAGRPHFLSEIDDNGVPVLIANFGPDGRLSGFTDGDGHSTSVPFSYNTTGTGNSDFAETTADALGFTTTEVTDAYGNVTRQVHEIQKAASGQSAIYSVIVRVYDRNNDLVAESRPFQVSEGQQLTAEPAGYATPAGDPNLLDPTAHPQDWSQRSAYDNLGNLLSSTDAAGRTTTNAYGQFGVLLSTTDAAGNTTSNSYDAAGNLLSSTDAAGNVTRYEYNPQKPGQLLAVGGPLGSGSTFAYDLAGRLFSTTDVNGKTTTFGYDGDNRITGSSFPWTDPYTPGAPPVAVGSSTQYDDQGRDTLSTDAEGNTTQTHYDALGHVDHTTSTMVGATAQTTYYKYDAAGNLVETDFPDGTVTRTAYDALNRPYLSMDRFNPADGPAARGTRSVYDGMGRSTETDRLSGLVIDVTANADGTYSSAVRAGTDQSVLSRSTTVYNPDGTVQKTSAPSIASPAGQETDYTYTPDGQELTVTEKAVPTWAAGALAPQDQTTRYAYDAAGRQHTVTGPRGDVTTFTYDANGNLTKTLFNDGTSITDVYDALGRKSSETDQTGATTDYTYDVAGHLKTVTEPAVTLYDTLAGTSSQVRPVYTYTYDAYGNLQTVDDANHHDTAYTYDAFGHQLTRTLPPVSGQPNATERQFYDAAGRLDHALDFDGNRTQYHYDALGRIDQVTYFAPGATAAAETVTYHYDGLGRRDTTTDSLAGAAAAAQVTTDHYDADGNLVEADTPTGTLHYAYDPATGLHTRTWTDGGDDTAYGYDGLGRLSGVTVLKLAGVTYGTLNADGTITGGLVTTYAYDAAGNRAHVARPNGTGTDYAYDTLNRLTDVTHRGPAGQVLFAQHYTLDADGRRTRDDETRLEPNGTTSSTTYTYVYDALGRLTAELVGPTGGQYDTTTAYYGYDRAGNRAFKADADPSADPGFLYAGNNATYSYDARDRLTAETDQAGFPGDPGSTQSSVAYTYDANGSQAGRTSTATGTDPSTGNPTQTTETDVSTYDVRDRLAAVTRDVTAQHYDYGAQAYVTDSTTHATVAYGYDDAGDRTSEVTSTTVTPAGGSPVATGKTTYYLVDANNPTGYSQVVEEKGSPTGAPVISYAVGQEVLGQSDGATVLYLLPDGHGSTRLVTNGAGSILATGRLDYDAWGNAVGFDPNTAATSILYTGQRYDAAVGLYDLRARMYDPVMGEFTSFDSFGGLLTDPRQLQKYLYADASPTNLADPSGHVALTDGQIIHTEIEKLYSWEHIGNTVETEQGVKGALGFLFPDIADFSLGEVAEIKPLSMYGLTVGPVQEQVYLRLLNGVSFNWRGRRWGVVPAVPNEMGQPWIESAWDPGVRWIPIPELPDEIVFTVASAGGVVFYIDVSRPDFDLSTARKLAEDLRDEFNTFKEMLTSGAGAVAAGSSATAGSAGLIATSSAATAAAQTLSFHLSFAISQRYQQRIVTEVVAGVGAIGLSYLAIAMLNSLMGAVD